LWPIETPAALRSNPLFRLSMIRSTRNENLATDTNQLPPLVNTTAQNFRLREVTGDKGYGALESRPSDALGDVHVGHADLVNEIAVGGDDGVIGLAAQHIDGAAGLIVLRLLVGKQRPGDGIGDAAARLVLVQRPLQRAHEKVC